ncbi:DUF1345 domain-containing protein [Xinfangfangia sp. CPCC 101601]|uniref:DUF1345 domain-containing protein n=1 Tax=Pseudogemmobacter lacusdianii TaxID=3069608 RepID=A0ABU0VZ70_9RHOB|nr:DUF1345 domain-containing protein [Xinfangfangia sp. CPCC 101601]MDQ2067044.1 DUF1345 domain-containing protein [Xinfangfangia sp. CPCC 101601]
MRAAFTRLQHPRFWAFLTVFAGTSLGLLALLPPSLALILGFDAGALVFVASTFPLWRSDAAIAARARSARDDGGRLLLLLISVAVLVVILVALGRLVAEASGWGTALIAGSLVLAWLFANLLFTFHYGHLYYDRIKEKDAGGITFPEGDEPVFADFAYFAFNIGMTCQTADLDTASTRIRLAVLMQGLFAFFFNLGVLAFSVNVLAS